MTDDELAALTERRRAARNAARGVADMERDDEAWWLQRYEDQIASDWQVDADVRRAERGYLGGDD